MDVSPIFIVSPLNRSGTNFLARLLCTSPELEIPCGINEDYFSVYSDKIVDYFDSTIKHWSKDDQRSLLIPKLMESFGDILLAEAVSRESDGKRLLFKCPRSKNVRNLKSLFPTAKIIVCIRDGQDTIESFLNSFNGYSFKSIARLWNEGVLEIRNCIKRKQIVEMFSLFDTKNWLQRMQ